MAASHSFSTLYMTHLSPCCWRYLIISRCHVWASPLCEPVRVDGHQRVFWDRMRSGATSLHETSAPVLRKHFYDIAVLGWREKERRCSIIPAVVHSRVNHIGWITPKLGYQIQRSAAQEISPRQTSYVNFSEITVKMVELSNGSFPGYSTAGSAYV
jgi:hypothetical protein